MNRLLGNTAKSLLACVLLLVMTAMLVNKVVYTHVHVLAEGSLVSHAHPFQQSSESNSQNTHQHTNLVLYLLDQLDILIYCIAALFILSRVVQSSSLLVPATAPLRPAFVPLHQVRPPPVLM